MKTNLRCEHQRIRCNTLRVDHRWGKRIEVDVAVRVMHPAMSRCGTGRLSNISLGGALIIGSLDSNVGARIQVSIPTGSGPIPYASVIDAYLVRRAGPAFAIEWTEFAPSEVIDLVRAMPSRDSQLALGM